MREEFLWVEKYRPKTIAECILPEGLKKTFSELVENKEIPNLLLSWKYYKLRIPNGSCPIIIFFLKPSYNTNENTPSNSFTF